MIAQLIMAAALLQADLPSVNDLGWLSGHWRTVEPSLASGPSFTEEIWSGAAGYSMIGVNRTVRGSRTTGYEYMRIEWDQRGTAFFGSPSGAPAVRFDLVAGTGTSVTFENRGHDYPQRIVYRRDGDTLFATVSLADGSRPMSWTFRRQP